MSRARLIAALVVAWQLARLDVAVAGPGVWLPYEPDEVELRGTVRIVQGFGPPGYGESPTEDDIVQGAVLVLDRPVNVGPKRASDDGMNASTFRNVRRVELWDLPDFTAYEGCHVAVRGTLSEKITGALETKVLCKVESISILHCPRTRSVTRDTKCVGSRRPALATQSRPSEEMATRIQTALERALCFEMYWLGYEYRRGVPLSVSVDVDGEWFFASIEDARVGARPGESWEFYIGVFDEQGARVLMHRSEGNFVQGALPIDRGFLDGARISFELAIPPDCPRYDPWTPEKERMIEKIVASLREEILRSNKRLRGIDEVHIVIGNFNVDDRSAFVWVEGTKEVYRVELHNPDGPDDRYQCGNYLVAPAIPGPDTQLSSRARRVMKVDLTQRIRAHGIRRTIVLEDEAGKASAPPSTPTPAAAGSSADAAIR
ncbi:MAG: hypothetical protein KatS3mg077_2613 [Candidatus Binatia bacterium]|nr:MAG: hypothetical protein KatS3mg077_2613 [Candidatus Binatia bacterium]